MGIIFRPLASKPVATSETRERVSLYDRLESLCAAFSCLKQFHGIDDSVRHINRREISLPPVLWLAGSFESTMLGTWSPRGDEYQWTGNELRGHGQMPLDPVRTKLAVIGRSKVHEIMEMAIIWIVPLQSSQKHKGTKNRRTNSIFIASTASKQGFSGYSRCIPSQLLFSVYRKWGHAFFSSSSSLLFLLYSDWGLLAEQLMGHHNWKKDRAFLPSWPFQQLTWWPQQADKPKK